MLFDVSSFGAPCRRGSGGWEMSGMARSTLACWCDVRAVFMRHHKYACGFLLYWGIYDSGVTVFALSEVIYLSSTVGDEHDGGQVHIMSPGQAEFKAFE